MLNFINQSIFLVGQHVDLRLIVSSQVQNSCLFLVVFDGKLVNNPILIVQYFIKAIRLSFKSLSDFIHLLIFQNGLIISLRFNLFEFNTMCSFNSFNFLLPSMFFLIHLIFPFHFRMHVLFLQTIICILEAIDLFLCLFFSMRQSLLDPLLFAKSHIQISPHIVPLGFGSCKIILQSFNFFLELFNSFLKDFLFGLEILSLFLLVENEPLHFYFELALNLPDTFFIFRLHLSQDGFVHGDDLIQRIRNSIPLFLQIGHLIAQDFILCRILSVLGRLSLHPLQAGDLPEQDVISQLAGSESQLSICAFSVLLGREVQQSLLVLLLDPPAHQQLLHLQQFLLPISFNLILKFIRDQLKPPFQ